MKITDGSAQLIAGTPDATIERAVALRRERMAVNAQDPNYSLAVMAPTNATAAAVSRAIRADRQRHGEVGPDQMELDAIDRTGRHKMMLGVGDDVRLYRKIWDGRRVIGNNSETARIKSLDRHGMDVRNLTTGVEGRIAWSQLPREKGEPAWLSYAGCGTIDAAQSSTVSEAMLIMADGTDGARANQVYTALSRHRDASYILVGDAAIRRQIAKSAVIGEVLNLKRDDVWRKVGMNISRVQTRDNATTAIREINRESGLSNGVNHKASESEMSMRVRLRDLSVTRAMEMVRQVPKQVLDLANEIVRQAREHRGPSLER